MPKRNCILWIPTLFHKPLEPTLKENINIKKTYRYLTAEEIIDPNDEIRINSTLVSNNNEDSEIQLELTLLKATEEEDEKNQEYPNRNILIKAFSNEEKIDELFLECKDFCQNGLILYEYNYDSNNNNYILDSDENIPDTVYHIIKSFYHLPDFLRNSNELMLTPFFTDEEVAFDTIDNPALFHYLSEFENLFLDKYEYIITFREKYDLSYDCKKKRLADIDPTRKDHLTTNETPLKTDIMTEIIELINDGYTPLLDCCYEILNMFPYYQALFYSEHNKLFNYLTLHNPVPENNENTSSAYQKAINISTVIESVRLQKDEITSILNNEHNWSLHQASVAIAMQNKTIINQNKILEDLESKVVHTSKSTTALKKQIQTLETKTTRFAILLLIAVFFIIALLCFSNFRSNPHSFNASNLNQNTMYEEPENHQIIHDPLL